MITVIHYMVINNEDGIGGAFETSEKKWREYREDPEHYCTWIEKE